MKIAIAGLGAMGSAVAFHLARRGHRVVTFDRFAPPHQLASSAGGTRIIREAYYEHPQYVPLIQRAYQNWEELERLSGVQVFMKTGGLMIGAPDGRLVAGARTSARTHRLICEELTSVELQRRFPAFHPAPAMSAIWEPRAGLLFADRCITAHLALARASGAELHTGEPIVSWDADAAGVSVSTGGRTVPADRLILACGPWMPALLEGVGIRLEVERTVQHWFQPAADDAEMFRPGVLPVYLLEFAPPNLLFYGFPDTGDGVKTARHHQGETTTPEAIERRVADAEVASMRELLEEYLPAANGWHLRSIACMYTNTPSCDFLIDAHPASSRVILASPCSGHGFKFSSAIGEVLADLATDLPARFDLAPFSR
jgi:sarcosine oxidase